MHGNAKLGLRRKIRNGKHGNKMRKDFYEGPKEAVLSSCIKQQWPQRSIPVHNGQRRGGGEPSMNSINTLINITSQQAPLDNNTE